MQQILIIIIIIAIFWIGRLIWKRFHNQKISLILYLIGGALLLLVVTGRVSWIVAPIATLISVLPLLIPKIFIFLRSFLFLRNTLNLFRNLKSNKWRSSRTHRRTAHTGNNSMSEKDALDILGLKAGATRKEIIVAHKRLIQKLHPDRGGSSALASQINTAKEVLLK